MSRVAIWVCGTLAVSAIVLSAVLAAEPSVFAITSAVCLAILAGLVAIWFQDKRVTEVAERQLAALEKLAERSIALPDAARSLEGAAGRLEGLEPLLSNLEKRWADDQQTATAALTGAVHQAADTIELRMTSAVDDVVNRTTASLTPVARDVVSGTAKAASAQLDKAIAHLVQEAKQRREADVQAAIQQRSDADALAQRFRQELSTAQQALAEELEHRRAADSQHAEDLASLASQVGDGLREHGTTIVAQVETLIARRAHADSELLERLRMDASAQLEEHRNARASYMRSVDERLTMLVERAEAQGQTLAEHTEAQRDLMDQRLSGLVEQAEAQARAFADNNEAQRNMLDERLTRLIEGASQQAEATRGQHSALIASFEGFAEGQKRAELKRASELGQLQASSTELMQTHWAELTQRLESVLQQTTAQMAVSAEADASTSDGLQAAASRVMELTHAMAEQQQAQVQALDAAVSTWRSQLGEATEASVTRQEAWLDAVEAQTSAHLAGFSESLVHWRTELAALEDVHSARDRAFIEALEESLGEQDRRAAKLNQDLTEGQQAAAMALIDKQAEHTQQVDESLERTGKMVEEIATMLHSGGTEFSAAAEMFVAATDRHREAGDKWLESLAQVDSAVLDAGENAAATALSNYLTRTHELFDEQLRFHRELLQQVGGSRNVVAPSEDLPMAPDVAEAAAVAKEAAEAQAAAHGGSGAQA